MPQNIAFKEWNIFDEVPKEMVGKYDLIHTRLIVCIVENGDPGPILKNFKKMLKPGGYLQWDDLDYMNCTIKTVTPGIKTPMLERMQEMTRSRGKHEWTCHLDKSATAEGFENSELWKYEDAMDMSAYFMENHVLVMSEFAACVQERGMDQEAEEIRSVCQGSYSESRDGVALCASKVVCVARKTKDGDENVIQPSVEAWWREDIGPRLKPAIEEFYEKWTGLSGEALRAHLHRIRDRAWACAPYPCVGQWMFLAPGIATFPGYPSIVARARQKGSKILDLGCCFGQDLRLLAADGVPSDSMYATDLDGDLWDLGYELFCDREKMSARFIQADIFDDTSRLSELEGKMDVVIVCHFIHLFDMQKQRTVIKKIFRLTNGPGAIVVGWQRGRERSLKKAMPWGEMFIHDLQTFADLWEKVGEATGTKWKVDAKLVDLKEWGCEKEDTVWMDKDPLGMGFVIARLK